ncbi:MAG TPA: hypothetical protein VKO63_08985, partial [Chitinispirillaceae bacterium]|nr:hypothetical protein [Chitinispirillaceae bacterium]
MRKLILIMIVLFTSLISANPLSWRTFSFGKNIIIFSGNELYSFSGESKSLSQLILDQNTIIDTIVDIINFENYLYFSTNAGIFQFDMSSQAVEKIVFNDNKNRSGKIASDIDYLWLCTSDTLFRFDKLGREWQPYPLPEHSTIKVIQSDSKQIDCFTEAKLNKFDIVTERWNTTSTTFKINDSVNILKHSAKLIALKNNYYLYHDKTFNSWNSTELPQQIVDIIPDQITYLACATTIYKIEDRIVKRVDLVQNDSILSIAKNMDTLLIANIKRLLKFDINTNRTVFIEYPQGYIPKNIKKIIVQNASIILFSENAILIYDSEKNLWNSIITQQEKKSNLFTWNEHGLETHFAPGYKSTLKGQFESMSSLKTDGFVKDTNIVNGNRQIDST